MTGKMLSNGTDMWGKATHAYHQQDVKGKSAWHACFQAPSVSERHKARVTTGAPCLLSKFVCCVKLWLSCACSCACTLRQEK